MTLSNYNAVRQLRAVVRRQRIMELIRRKGGMRWGIQAWLARKLGVSDATISSDLVDKQFPLGDGVPTPDRDAKASVWNAFNAARRPSPPLTPPMARLEGMFESPSPEPSSKHKKPRPAPTRLSPAHEAAYQAYLSAVKENPGLTTDAAAYEWLARQPRVRRKLPSFDNWVRYLRRARLFYDTRKRVLRPNATPEKGDAT